MRKRGCRARELRILNAIAEALNSAVDVRQAIERTLALVADFLDVQAGWAWLLDPETQQFYNVAVYNLPPFLQEPVRMTGNLCSCIDEFRTGRLTARNVDVIECSRLQPALDKADPEDAAATRGLRYHASIPLYFQGRPLGILNLTGPEWRELTHDELRLFSIIANQVSVAVERARLAEEAARRVRTDERARIAREIHDTLAQGLTAIVLHIEGALPHLDTQPDVARKRLQRALTMAREGLDDARRSVQDLRDATPDGRPLGEALGALTRAFTSETGVRVTLHIAAPDGLSLRVEAELYRIAQEALANVRRHTTSTEVTVLLRASGDRIRLTIRDNGQGFDPRAVPEGRHGLIGARERARLLGGSLRVESRAGRGTTLVVTVPNREDSACVDR